MCIHTGKDYVLTQINGKINSRFSVEVVCVDLKNYLNHAYLWEPKTSDFFIVIPL